jgi:hypothetical protein
VVGVDPQWNRVCTLLLLLLTAARGLFFPSLRDGGKTMRDSGFVKRELEQYILSGANVDRVLDTARTQLDTSAEGPLLPLSSAPTTARMMG